MKTLLIGVALLTVPCVVGADWKDPEREIAPSRFKSTAEAEEFVDHLFAGGRAQVVELDRSEVLVFQIFGSGNPTISVRIYVPDRGGWILQRTWRPKSAQRFEIEVVDGRVFVIGKVTRERWEVFRYE